MDIDIQQFREFLIEAKINTYAGNGELLESSRPGSKDLPYRKGQYYYLDSYVGELNFIGEEVVWYKDSILWGMNYYGEMLVDDIPEGFSYCLKEALKKVEVQNPYRGPEEYRCKEFEYRCSWYGELDSFYGDEGILHNGKLIYRLRFHGGFLK